MLEDVNMSIVNPSDGKGDIDGKKDNESEKSNFYAVSIPDDFSSICVAQPLVFTSKTDALAAIKIYPGARFMQFSSYEKAIEYGSKPLPNSPSQTSCGEEKSVFKSLTSQEMVSLRKAIEAGDEASFLDKVWSNPRYLINSAGDGPTILQEGTRYNALHVAAKFKKTNMCLCILNTLYDEGFISELYPNESSSKIKDRIKRLVDLYLNTPDKSLSETPLHFACKYGADQILSILLSFPECDINKCNKYGTLAKEMICYRVSDCLHLKDKMLLMFEDLFYVPVLRDVTSNIQEIGKPCRSNIVLEATSLTFSSDFVCGKHNLLYCAFAGPMSENAAYNFYKMFSKKKFTEQLSFTPEQKKQLIDICLSDSEKGLERVGRTLAKEFGIGWSEFWPKLKFWGDLSSAVGLEFLDNHLKNQYEMTNTLYSPLELKSGLDTFSYEITKFVDAFVKKLPQILSNKSKMTFFMLLQSLLPYTFCMTDFSFSDEQQIFLIHHEIGQLLYLKLIESNKEGFEAIKSYINTQFVYIHNFLNTLSSCGCEKWRMFLCILKYACYSQSSNVLVLKPQVCSCNWIVKRDCYTYSSSLSYHSVFKLRQNFVNRLAFTSYPLKTEESRTSTLTDMTQKDRVVFPSTVLENREIDKDSAFEQGRGQPLAVSFSMHKDIGDLLDKYCDIGKVFLILADKFCCIFCSLILNYSSSVPFNSNQTFFDVFKQVMPFFKPLCDLNYSKDFSLIFHHNEIAVTVLSKMHNVSLDILHKWKAYFKNTDIFNDRNFDLYKFGVTSTKEWIHLFCVIKHLSILLDKYAHAGSICICQFESHCKNRSIKTAYCSNCLKELQKFYKVVSDYEESTLLSKTLKLLSINSTEEEEDDETEIFFTPPESPTCNKIGVFINGTDFSDDDIDILRAVVDGGATEISKVEYPYVFSWKCLMESKLGSFLKPEDRLSCTPSSSSATVRRAVMPKERVRRTLF